MVCPCSAAVSPVTRRQQLLRRTETLGSVVGQGQSTRSCRKQNRGTGEHGYSVMSAAASHLRFWVQAPYRAAATFIVFGRCRLSGCCEIVRSFPQSLQAGATIVRRLVHVRFLTNPFQFSTSLLILHSAQLLTAAWMDHTRTRRSRHVTLAVRIRRPAERSASVQVFRRLEQFSRITLHTPPGRPLFFMASVHAGDRLQRKGDLCIPHSVA
jgi:hypothetical protein